MSQFELFLNWSHPYYHTIFVLVLIFSFFCYVQLKSTYTLHIFLSVILSIVVALYLGFTPIPWGTGGDRELYANGYNNIASGITNYSSDIFFYSYQKIFSSSFDTKQWFVLTSIIYCLNYLIFSISIRLKYPFLLLLMFFSSLFFYGYGINTIRAGFAASFLLLAIAFYDKLFYFVFFMLIAVNSHFSMIIPALAMLVSRFFDKTKIYLILWLIAIPLSAVAGHSFEALFSFMTSDDRVSYLSVDTDDTHYNVGFRIDFILYSCVPVIMGYYYIIKGVLRIDFIRYYIILMFLRIVLDISYSCKFFRSFWLSFLVYISSGFNLSCFKISVVG